MHIYSIVEQAVSPKGSSATDLFAEIKLKDLPFTLAGKKIFSDHLDEKLLICRYELP